QSFYVAISQYPQLSSFASFYQNDFPAASQLLTNSSTEPLTVLVPNNDAFIRFENENGYAVTSLSSAELTSLIQYHVLVGSLTATNFTETRGLTAPSLLTGEQYDNRSAGSALLSTFPSGTNVEGQVVFIQSRLQSASKLLIRAGLESLEVRSGLSSIANLTSLDGVWDSGRFQMIDRFLTLPEHCSSTIRNGGLTSLDSAINQTHIWGDLDKSPNFTCLGPTNQAFADANHPETNLGLAPLASIMHLHTIPQVLYTNFLQDGQVYLSNNNLTIQVSIKGQDIYFNDAKVIEANLITNNGVLHVINKVF
ncbi:FAS1 domain-containing protein, partial [Acephala macrosclerotiorum]